MDGVPEALWSLADEHSRLGRPAVAIKCLESIVQSSTLRLLPTVEISTRLRLADLLLLHTHNLHKAKSHLERAHLLLHSAPASAFHLKCRAHALLARCYNLLGAIQPQRLMLQRAVEFVANSAEADSEAGRLWTCNFYSQLAGACGIAGDHHAALSALDKGFEFAVGLDSAAGLQMYFATMTLHVHLLDWKDIGSLEKAIQTCKEAWEVIHPDHRQQYLGLFFYHKLLHAFYLLRMCDYKGAGEHIEMLDTAMKNDLHLTQQIEALASEYNSVKRSLSRPDLHNKERLALNQKYGQLHEQLRTVMFTSFSSQEYDDQSDFESAICTLRSKLQLAPFPIDGEWLPKCAVYAIVDLMAVMLGRPKGLFKDCGRRIQSGLDRLHEELGKLGITNDATEVDMRKTDIWMAGLYLNILMHFLENKVAVELTRSEFVEAREALRQMIDWYVRFPVLLQGCESIIEMLRGLYSHSLGCLNEAIFHFMEAIKLTTSKPVQTMCQVYAAVSYICIGDAESSSQALDLIGPIYRVVDSFVGVREKTCVIFVYGLLLMKQQNLQESRIRLASGLKIAHQHLGNIQLVSQFLTILGSLALQLHDTAQAREILKSSLTLAKTLYDVPTQIWVLSVLTDLYKEIGDRGNEMENAEYERKKEDDLQKRLSEAQSSVHHYELIEKSRVTVKQVRVSGAQRASDGSSIKRELEGLDIPESVGIHTPPSVTSLPRLREVDTTRRGKKKI